jgi:hypothetical protein
MINNFPDYTSMRHFFEALEEINEFFHDAREISDAAEKRRLIRARKEQALRRKRKHLLRTFELSGARRGSGLEQLRALGAYRQFFSLSGTQLERIRNEAEQQRLLSEGADQRLQKRKKAAPLLRNGSGGNRLFRQQTKGL